MPRSPKAVRILVTAAGAVFFSHAAYGAVPTLSTYYTSGEIAQNVNFTTGTQSVSISNTSPTVFVPLGEYFEFGLSLDLSNNPNPNAGLGSPAQPSTLGLAIVNYTVTSTDPNGTMLQPTITSTVIGGAPGGQTQFDTTEVFTNTTPSVEQVGDAEVPGGDVGDYTTITEGDFATPTGTTVAGAQRLSLWSGAVASAADATPYFLDLGYKAVGSGVLDLTPAPSDNGNGTDYYDANGQKTSGNPYGYEFSNLAASGGAITPIAPMVVDVSLEWDGQSDHTTWNTSVTNWNNGISSTSTYANPDFVTFDDTAPSNSTAINLSTAVSPILIEVSSNTNNYSISGTGSIAGSGALLKNGNSTLTLSTSNTFTGGSTINAGTLVAGAGNALGTNGPLTINNSAEVKLATSTGLATLSSLLISASGTFDIGNNHVIINYGATDPKATILQYLQSGVAGGKWNGPGIDSSAAVANSAYGVGFADGADHVVTGLSSGQIELKYTLYGDINLDGVVNGIDFGILAANFNKGVSNGWEQGDFLYTGVVNGVDFGLLASNFNKGNSGADTATLVSFAEANGLLADVPEPASIGLVLGSVGLLGARRRRR